MKYLLFIALGGASGSVARYLLAGWAHRLWEGHWPVGTLLAKAGSGLGVSSGYGPLAPVRARATGRIVARLLRERAAA